MRKIFCIFILYITVSCAFLDYKHEYKSNFFSKKRIIWSSFDINKRSLSSPIVTKDSIYLYGDDKYLYKLNKNGILIWKKKVNIKEKFKNISYKEKNLFLSFNNKLLKINSDTSEIQWQKDFNNIISSSVVFNENKIFFTTYDNNLYCLDVYTGEVIWIHFSYKKELVTNKTIDPIIYNDYIYAFYSSGKVYYLDKKNGKEIWSLDLTNFEDNKLIFNNIFSIPLIKEDKIYVMNSTSIKLIDFNGNARWKKDIEVIGNLLANKLVLFAISKKNELLALNKEDGKKIWSLNLSNHNKKKKKLIYYLLDIIDDKLILGNSNNDIFVISINEKKIIDKIRIGRNFEYFLSLDKKQIYLHNQGRFTNYLSIIQFQ